MLRALALALALSVAWAEESSSASSCASLGAFNDDCLVPVLGNYLSLEAKTNIEGKLVSGAFSIPTLISQQSTLRHDGDRCLRSDVLGQTKSERNVQPGMSPVTPCHL